MKVWYVNRIDGSTVTVAATSEVSTLPATNLQHDFRKRVFRSNSTPVTFLITFDLASAFSVTGCFILDHTIDSDCQVFIEASANNFATTPFSREIPWVTEQMADSWASVTYRYWRLRVTVVTGVPVFDIGRMFIGDLISLNDEPEYEDYSETANDPSRIQTTLGGQQYVDEVDKYKLIDLSWRHARQSTYEQLAAINEHCGRGRSFLIQVDTVVNPLTTFYYVRQDTELKADSALYTDAYISTGEILWNVGLRLREQV